MNDVIQQLVTYLLSSTDSKTLQNIRLTQMIYLADWKSCLVSDKQITDIAWEINNLGPFSSNVLKAIIHSRNHFIIGSDVLGKINFISTKISLSHNPINADTLSEYTKQILDFVIHQTESLDAEAFISLIYSTYPVFKSKRFSQVNLKALSIEYKSSRFWNDKSSSFAV